MVKERRVMNEIGEELIRDTVRGLSRFVILWLVSQSPISGYRILKRMEQIVERKFTTGVIYPLLYEMEEGGYLSGKWSHRGRKRVRYYSITPKGIKALDRVKEFFDLPVKEALREFLSEQSED